MTPAAASTPTLALSPALAQGAPRLGSSSSGGFAAALDASAASTIPSPSIPPSATASALPATGGAGGWLQGPRLQGPLNPKSEAETRQAIHKSAQDFESTTMGQMLQLMSDTVEVDPDFGGGHGEEMFRQMLTTEYGKLMRKAGPSGVSSQIERELLRAQGLKPLPVQSSSVVQGIGA